jgi:hypothetical protein
MTWRQVLEIKITRRRRIKTKTKLKEKDGDGVNHTQEREKGHFQVHFYILYPTAPPEDAPIDPERLDHRRERIPESLSQ